MDKYYDFTENPQFPYKMRDWIANTYLHYKKQNSLNLSIEITYDLNEFWLNMSKNTNPVAIDLLEKNPTKICWHFLSRNPSAIRILEKTLDNLEKADWRELSKNPAAVELLEKYPRKINWFELSRNPGAKKLLENNHDRYFPILICCNPAAINIINCYYEFNPEIISWSLLSGNPAPAAIKLLEKNPDRINWHYLSENPAPGAIKILEKNPDKIKWFLLSKNPAPGAIKLLEKNPDKIDWDALSMNPSWEAIRLLEKNPDKINWINIVDKPAAIHLLEQYQHKIVWYWISQNPACFTYDYEQMKHTRAKLHEELIAAVFHPRRVAAFLEAGGDLDDL